MRFTVVVCLCALATGTSPIEARQPVQAIDVSSIQCAAARGERIPASGARESDAMLERMDGAAATVWTAAAGGLKSR